MGLGWMTTIIGKTGVEKLAPQPAQVTQTLMVMT